MFLIAKMMRQLLCQCSVKGHPSILKLVIVAKFLWIIFRLQKKNPHVLPLIFSITYTKNLHLWKFLLKRLNSMFIKNTYIVVVSTLARFYTCKLQRLMVNCFINFVSINIYKETETREDKRSQNWKISVEVMDPKYLNIPKHADICEKSFETIIELSFALEKFIWILSWKMRGWCFRNWNLNFYAALLLHV